jgi:catechol 2,3-dioxygenase
MATDPLDVEGVLAARGNRSGVHGLPRGARIGHVHLQVADVHQSEAFYCGVLGFELVTHYGASASFVSAGGYHHHIGMNTWAGQGAPPPPAGALGLMYASILVPTPDDLTAVRKRIDVAGVAVESRGTGLFVRDPSGNGLVLAVEAARAA